MNLARLGEENVQRFGEYVALHFGWPGRVVLVGGGGDGARARDEWIADEPDAFESVDRADDDLAVVLYTSGTTGRPKGVALSTDASPVVSAHRTPPWRRRPWSACAMR